MGRGERLEILRKIERLPPDTDMEAYLKTLTPARLKVLREAVDWVEKYEMQDMLADGV